LFEASNAVWGVLAATMSQIAPFSIYRHDQYRIMIEDIGAILSESQEKWIRDVYMDANQYANCNYILNLFIILLFSAHSNYYKDEMTRSEIIGYAIKVADLCNFLLQLKEEGRLTGLISHDEKF
jgi:hypothetical protein